MSRKRPKKMVAGQITFLEVWMNVRKPSVKPGHVHKTNKHYTRRDKSWLHEK